MPSELRDMVAEVLGLLDVSIPIASSLAEGTRHPTAQQVLRRIAEQQGEHRSAIEGTPLGSQIAAADEIRTRAAANTGEAWWMSREGGWLEQMHYFASTQQTIVRLIADLLRCGGDVASAKALARMQLRHERYGRWCSVMVAASSLTDAIFDDPDDEAGWPLLPYQEARGEIFVDLETRRLAEEVEGGWQNIPALGLAVAVTWDREFSFRTWFEEDAHRLVDELRRFERIVGFNIIRFDYAVLRAYRDLPVSLIVKAVDLLVDVERRLGHRVSLENLATATLGRGKIGGGVAAVSWFRKGELDKVIRYCQEDVALTRDLYYRGCQDGCLHYLDGGERKRVEVEWEGIEPEERVIKPPG